MNPVYLFVPNLIGYSRILFLCVSGYYATTNPKNSLFFYTLSYLLDAVDGVSARYFKQSSRFGAILDMLTDRLSTLGLSFVLAHQNPDLLLYFIAFSYLDIGAHWVHFLSKVEAGGDTHKTGNFWILEFYYTFPYALLVVCVGQELFLLVWYIQPYLANGSVLYHYSQLLMTISFPVFAFKQLTNVLALVEAIDFYATTSLAKHIQERKQDAEKKE